MFYCSCDPSIKERIALNETSPITALRHVAYLPYTVLGRPAIQHKWTRPDLTTASKLILHLPTPEGWEVELS